MKNRENKNNEFKLFCMIMSLLLILFNYQQIKKYKKSLGINIFFSI